MQGSANEQLASQFLALPKIYLTLSLLSILARLYFVPIITRKFGSSRTHQLKLLQRAAICDRKRQQLIPIRKVSEHKAEVIYRTQTKRGTNDGIGCFALPYYSRNSVQLM